MFSYSSYCSSPPSLSLHHPPFFSAVLHFPRHTLCSCFIFNFSCLLNFLIFHPPSVSSSLASKIYASPLLSFPFPCLQASSLIFASLFFPHSPLNIAPGHSPFFLPRALSSTVIPPSVSAINGTASPPNLLFALLRFYLLSDSRHHLPRFPCAVFISFTYGFMFMLMTFLPPCFAHSPVTSRTAAV